MKVSAWSAACGSDSLRQVVELVIDIDIFKVSYLPPFNSQLRTTLVMSTLCPAQLSTTLRHLHTIDVVASC